MKKLIDLRRQVLHALSAVAALSLAGAGSSAENLDTFPTTTAQISTASGKQQFKIWVADTPARSEQGLMFIHSLPPNQGMLFPANNSGQMAMWMKNTLIPLDMLFIDRGGDIIFIQHDAKPKSEAIIRLPAPVMTPVAAVLELAGGECRRRHIEQGDHVTAAPVN